MIPIGFGLDEEVRLVLVAGGLCLLLMSGCDAAMSWREAAREPATPGLSAPGEANRGLATRSMTAFRSANAADPLLAVEKPEQATRLAEPLWTFGLNLLSRQAARTKGNVVLSPVSLHAVLSMMLDGAGAGTAAEMRRVLGVEALSTEDRRAAWAGLIRRANHTDRAEVRVAPSLWTRSGLALRPEFATAQASAFAADSYPLPEDATQAAAAINGWVAERTGDRITRLLPTVS